MAYPLPANNSTFPSYDKDKNKRFSLCIKMVPAHVKPEDLKDILEQYGKVIIVKNQATTNSKFPYRFAECSSEEEMKAIINGMKTDESGYIVEQKKKNSGSSSSSGEQTENNRNELKDNENIIHSLQQFKLNANSRNIIKDKLKNYNQSHEITDKLLKSEETQNILPKANQNIQLHYSDSTKIYKCHLCDKRATKCCGRCEEIYCSAECQDKDWAKHKYVCFKKPNLIDIPNLVSGQKQQNRTNSNNKFADIKKDKHSEKNGGGKYPSESRGTILYNENNKNNNSSDYISANEHQQNIKEFNGVSKSILNSNHENKTDLSDKSPNISYKKNQNDMNGKNIEENKTKLINKIERAALPLSGQKVVVTHFEQLNRIYIRSNAPEDNEIYLKTISIVNDSAKISKHLTIMPKPKDMVISQFEGDWYRALVLHPESENSILIAYIDFGNAEKKKLCDLKEMQQDLYSFKRYPICVSLKGVPNVMKEDISPNCNSYLQGLINNIVQMRIKYTEGEKDIHQLVELFEYQNDKHVNQEIRNLLNDKKNVKDTGKSVFSKDLKHVKFSASKDKDLIILDNSFIDGGFLTCVLNDNLSEFENTVKIMKEYASKDPNPYEPLESELCIVKASENPETWYRASCENILENGRLELSLIDFGSICEEPIQNVRKYPADLNIPCFANVCFIKGLEKAVEEDEIDYETKSKLIDLLQNFSFITVPKIEVIDNEIYIHLPADIVQQIKEKEICSFDEV